MKGMMWVATAVLLSTVTAGCELIEGGRTRAELIGDIAQDNAQTTAVMREAFRRGTFDDALAAVMEDTTIAEEVFAIVHGHPLLGDGTQMAAGEQMTPAELLKMMTAPARRRALAAARAPRPSAPVVSRAPGEQVLDETIRVYTRLEREAAEVTPYEPGTRSLPTDPVERRTTSDGPVGSTVRSSGHVPEREVTTAPTRVDSSPGTSAVRRRNERVGR